MTTRIGIGFSNNLNAADAAREAAGKAKLDLGQPRIDAAILFSSIHYDPKDFLDAAYEALDRTRLIGCSTGGIILTDRIERRGIGIITFSSEELKFEPTHTSHINLQDPYVAGKTFSDNAPLGFGKKDLKLFLYFTENQSIDSARFLDGINEQVKNCPVFGAGSSDDFRLQQTYQFCQNKSMTKGAAGFFVCGAPTIGISSRHGWRPLGKPRKATSTEKNIIKLIDKQKAINIYQEYLDEKAATLSASPFGQINIRYPLGYRCPTSSDYLLRRVLNVKNGSNLICQNNIAKNAEIHIMIGSKDSCLLAAENAALDVKHQLKGKPAKCIILIECLARNKVLGRAVKQEIQVIRSILGESAPVFGMYSFGEICTFKNEEAFSPAYLQNGSLIILAIS